ncbi:class I SAM-dependent methyltransferase [Moorena producens JHB]|uniref:Class I SAM-dependent methyltransferase n=1 Tax=Moorena producens (strain JHB) TaxID=1454205 RepID=A0A1D9G5U9_MOOP1|nr:class I SAM-dependent methyltransferase [Moorena producens]AOY83008.1 class I SAM-dependent methyltransferase [Moorena producens JHB]
MKDIKQLLQAIYSKDLEEKKIWYSSVAEAYDQARPRYPQQLINRAVELAQLPADGIILEVGCGPGTATTAFADLGFSIVAIEPSQESCQLARHNCSQYPDVELINTTFEEWELETGKFDAILAATSFHWVSQEIRYQKTADALKENGFMILLWNTPPQPNYEVCQLLNQVYQTHAPSLKPYEEIETHQRNLSKIAETVINSGKFQDLVSEQLVCDVTYSIDNYIALLSTLSPYIALDPKQRESLFQGIQEILELEVGNSLETSYLSVLQVAKKI